MKFSKNGEQSQIQKKQNFRFDENGHIIVPNRLPIDSTTSQKSRKLAGQSTLL